MNRRGDYFFCGVGGSGMTPLALIVQARGGRVEGSDRALDQGRDAAKFDFLRAHGVRLHPQDGSGVTRADQILVTSAAVEDTVPDVLAARRIGAAVTTRAQLLAELFNASACGVGVAGTSGKSTTTGMIGWILHRAGRDPTIMNGAEMKNFSSLGSPFAGARIGDGEEFVCEIDESDGSIALFSPRVAVLNNISLDHNALAELGAASACGVGLSDAAKHLGEFSGIRRRLEVVGTANEITVIDDFAHNPDKIAATLQTMHAFAGRLLLMFQPHGYGPLRLMRDNLVDCFACGLLSEDALLMPEPVYFGGTVDRSVGSGEIVGEIVRRGRKALALPDRSACGEKLVQLARRGDRILVMGARDDSLSQFARDLVQRVERIGKV